MPSVSLRRATGAAGNLSAVSLFETAEILEQLGRDGRFDAADAAWRRLSGEAAHVLDVFGGTKPPPDTHPSVHPVA